MLDYIARVEGKLREGCGWFETAVIWWPDPAQGLRALGIRAMHDASTTTASSSDTRRPDGSLSTADCQACTDVFEAVRVFADLRAIKLYRLEVPLDPPVPGLPCLDHEAMLHEGIAPHAAAYVETQDDGELHEIVLIPSRRRVEIDTASTVHEHSSEGRERLLGRLRDQFPDWTLSVNGLSWVRGDRRVARACRAQVPLREVLSGNDFDQLEVSLDRLRTVGALMEKQSRVASWSVRTVTGPMLAVLGFLVYQGLGRLAPQVGGVAISGLQAAVVGATGTLFLYFGLKAVHLTEMANRVWKRASEYRLILDERRRLAPIDDAETARLGHQQEHE